MSLTDPLARLADLAQAEHLAPMGTLHLTPEDGLPERFGTLVLLGPAEPGF